MINLKKSVVNAKAEKTVVKYANSFKNFVTWTNKYPEIKSVLPADELYVSLYMQHLMQTKSHYSSIEAAFYGIKWAHDLAAVQSPCTSPIVISVLEAAKRKLNRPIQKKKPVEEDSMRKLFDCLYNQQNLKSLRILTMCFLSFFGFLRYDEVSKLKTSNITFNPDHVDIFIEKAKTDCYRKGKNVLIAKLNSQRCPVKLLTEYLEMANLDLSGDEYIFRAITFCKASNTYVLRKRNQCISYTRTRELIKEALSGIGLNAKEFGTHSFRAAGATLAAKRNISDRLFKIHGRWKSESAKDGYVSETLEKRLSVSRNLQL